MRFKKKKLIPKILLFSFGWVLIAAYGLGQAGQSDPKAIQLKIGTILASNEGKNFDPRLAPMKNQLNVFKYQAYQLLKEETKVVPWKGNAAFEIPGGRSLTVTPQEYRDDRIALKVRLLKGDQPFLDTVVRLRNGGRFLLGGPAHENGVLILSIGASTQ
jgi:hypothetical protein